MRPPRSDEILQFWFSELSSCEDFPSHKAQTWFTPSEEVDQEIYDRFYKDLYRADAGEYESWQKNAQGRLALVLLFDQFPRNMFRHNSRAFLWDTKALKLVYEGLAIREDLLLFPIERAFFYMPLMHSEEINDQTLSCAYFSELCQEAPPQLEAHFRSFLKYANAHKKVIERFGRFPHRNTFLGRESSLDEIDYLEKGGGF